MKKHEKLQPDQLYCLLTLLLLSPALRLFPSAAVKLAGRGAWLCALAAYPVMLLYMRFLRRLTLKAGENGDIYTLAAKNFPLGLGKFALIIPGAWFILYSGFILRSGADRFITSVYPNTSAAFFTVSLTVPCLASALMSAAVTGRFSKLVLPAVAVTAAFIVIKAGGRIEVSNLLPVTVGDVPSLLRGTVPALDVLCLPVYISLFALPYINTRPGSMKRSALWLLGMCLILTLICVSVLGFFGAELTAELSWPFFSLVRNLVFFRSIERSEALVVALWVFTDFAAVSFSLRMASACLCASAETKTGVTVISAAAACILGLVTAPDKAALALWSEKLIPAINLSVAFVYLPLLLFLSRKKSGNGKSQNQADINKIR